MRIRQIEKKTLTVLRSAGLCTALSGFMMFALVGQLSANPLWEWVNPLPQGLGLSDVIAVEGMLVAVGAAGSVVNSTDGGQTWSVRHTSNEYQLLNVEWGNGRFVAVGSKLGEELTPVLGVILSSEDGITWTERLRVEWAVLQCVSWNGTHFVAIGAGGLSYTGDPSIGGQSFTSDDGLSWQAHALPSREWSLFSIVWTGTTFVAIGRENYYYNDTSAFTSVDGVEWQIYPLEGQPLGLVFDGEKLVASMDGGVLISYDGMVWEFVEVEGLVPIDLAYADGLYVTVGNGGQVATSPDAYSWSFGDLPVPRYLFGITWDGSFWVAVGSSGITFRSPDTQTWEEIGGDAFGLSSSSVLDLAWGGGRFVGVGESGLVMTSSDGLTWTHTWAPVGSGLPSVKWIEDRFWIVGRGGDVFTTVDGETWVLLLRHETHAYYDMAHSGTTVVVVGRDPSNATLATSADEGQSWTFHTLPIEGALLGVEWTGERFVAVGMSGMVATSHDGLEWEVQSLGSEITLTEVVWNGNSLAAVGYGWESGYLYGVSETGTEWELKTFPGELGGSDDLTWTGSCFVAVNRSASRDKILTSADGDVWLVEGSGTGLGLMATVSDRQQLIATGLRGTIVRRTELPQCIPMPRRPDGRSAPDPPVKSAVAPLSVTGAARVEPP